MSKYNILKFRSARFYPFCVNPHRGNYVVRDHFKQISMAPEIKAERVVNPFTVSQAVDFAAYLNDENKSWSAR